MSRALCSPTTHNIYFILYSTSGKILSKYCNKRKTQEWVPSTYPPLPPHLYHGGGETFLAHPRVKSLSYYIPVSFFYVLRVTERVSGIKLIMKLN